MTDTINRSQAAYLHRSAAWLAGGFAGMALLLGVLGLYGVIAYSVSQRTRELGVRLALGATRAAIVALVLRQSMLPILAGLALGVAGAVGAGQLLTSFLYDVRPTDLRVITTVAVLLVAVGIIASWLPARRAAMVDPLVALREE